MCHEILASETFFFFFYLGGCILNLSKTSGYKRGKTTISFSAEMCLLKPPMLSNRTWITKTVMFRLTYKPTVV